MGEPLQPYEVFPSYEMYPPVIPPFPKAPCGCDNHPQQDICEILNGCLETPHFNPSTGNAYPVPKKVIHEYRHDAYPKCSLAYPYPRDIQARIACEVAEILEERVQGPSWWKPSGAEDTSND